MDINEYITANHKILYTTAKNITKGHQLTDDLYQHCIEVLLVDKDEEKIQLLIDKNQLQYYFTAILIRNYHSSTSRFHYQYRKASDMISDKDVYGVEVPEDEFDGFKEAKIEFIEKQIENMDWYDKQLVKLYFYDNMSYRKIAELTKIPKTSIYNGITSIKNKIKNKL